MLHGTGRQRPFLVFEDADLDKAIDGVMIAKMRNGGQACTAANRIYVQRGIQAEFASRLAARMAALTVGPGTDPSTEVGPLVDQASVLKVDALVRDALDQGAPCSPAGRCRKGKATTTRPRW